MFVQLFISTLVVIVVCCAVGFCISTIGSKVGKKRRESRR